jgi:hypothetical protein
MSDGENGWRPWFTVPRIVGGVIAIPVVAGFVALGATVLEARSLRELVRETWSRLPSRRTTTSVPDEHADSDAA